MPRSTVFELSTILMIRGCTSLAHPQIIKIINNLETVGRRKNLSKQKFLSRCFTSYSVIIFMLRSTIFELSTILMIRGCTSLAHPQIINNFETVGRRKLIKTKNAYFGVSRLSHLSFLCYVQRFLSYR